MIVITNCNIDGIGTSAFSEGAARVTCPMFAVSNFPELPHDPLQHSGFRIAIHVEPEFLESRFAKMHPRSMKTDMERQMVTIKAVTVSGQTIEWNYDTPQQCALQWKEITKTGNAPDNSGPLIRAFYFGPKNKPGMGPDKAWMS